MSKPYFSSRSYSNRSEDVGSSANGKYYMEANRRIENAVEKRDDAYDEAVTAIAAYAIAASNSGASNTKNIVEEISKLLRKFNDAERSMILTRAMASVIVNS